MRFIPTISIAKIAGMTQRIKVVQGGTYAGKTYAIIALLIDFAVRHKDSQISIVAETIPAVRDGAVRIFKMIMQDTGNWIQDHWRSQPMEYKFSNRSVVQFKSFETVGRAQASGKRDVLFLNEANYISFEIADALMIRTSGDIFIDFNPTVEFWAHTEVLKKANAGFLKLTYKDNRPLDEHKHMGESMPASIMSELMDRKEKAKTSKYWENWCRVYLDGEIGQLQGTVFENWQTVGNVTWDSQLIGYGLDFGFTNDPTALVSAWQSKNGIVWDEVIYKKGLLNEDLVKLMIRRLVKKNVPVYADNSDPRLIAEIRALSKRESPPGFNVLKCDKRGGINFGISILQDQKFRVTSRSVNLIKELRNYSWKRSKTGESLNEPIDRYNHAIDAMRYLAVAKLTNREVSTKSKVINSYLI